MKKLFFALVAVVLMASSCNKCGYCRDAYGNSDGAVCQSSNPVAALDGESYKQAKADCSSQGGTWVITK